MRVIDKQQIEDCFDGSSIYGYTFDEPVSREDVFSLKAVGTLDYFPNFARPFFRVRTGNGMQIKGIEGDKIIRVIYPSKDREMIMEEFEGRFKGLDGPNPNTA